MDKKRKKKRSNIDWDIVKLEYFKSETYMVRTFVLRFFEENRHFIKTTPTLKTIERHTKGWKKEKAGYDEQIRQLKNQQIEKQKIEIIENPPKTEEEIKKQEIQEIKEQVLDAFEPLVELRQSLMIRKAMVLKIYRLGQQTKNLDEMIKVKEIAEKELGLSEILTKNKTDNKPKEKIQYERNITVREDE